jgi:hypothetical protein
MRKNLRTETSRGKDENFVRIQRFSFFEGALPRQSSIEQLNKVRKISKGTDIGDRISDLNKQGANIQYSRNPIDKGIESIEKYWKKNKKFKPNTNLKRFKDIK